MVEKLRKLGHDVSREHACNHEVIFDIYDKTTDTAYEILTAKIIRSTYEKDEAIIAKIFSYLLHCKNLIFVLVSYNHEELEIFHKLKLEHIHLECNWNNEIIAEKYHKGFTAREIAKRILKLLKSIAPIDEWISEDRRKKHSKMPEEFEKLTKKYGLPENFLKGLWKDWHLAWVLRMEKALLKWKNKRLR